MTALGTRPTANPSLATRLTLIATGLMTILAGATIAPAIPEIREVFADHDRVRLLSAMVLSTHAIAIVAVSPPAGILVDRWGRKPMLLTGLALIALGGSSGAWLPNLEAILAGRLVLGAGVAFVMTSATTLIADLFDGEARQRLMGQQLAASTVGGMAFILGGGALAALQWRVAFLIYLVAAVLLIAAAVTVPIVRTGAGRDTAAEPGPARLRPLLLAPLAAALLSQAVFYTIPTQLPSFLAGRFGFNPFEAALVLTVTSAVSLPIALNFHRVRRLLGPVGVTVFAFASMATGLLVLSRAAAVWVVVLALVCFALGMSTLMPNLNSWTAALADGPVRGRAMGLLGSTLFAGQFLSPIATQPVIDRIGLQPTLAALAAAAALVGAAYATARRRLAPAP
ncbi:MFS transporter [Glycomyces xiaoerkulensis]|uniref:MFS transporter n=1 Tax=Glycomyces xiaoerkulensis TaxID=2038139 RepID=UPI000C256BCA|nr:MFS transporter [Glycomyces xiaoerkulensis]